MKGPPAQPTTRQPGVLSLVLGGGGAEVRAQVIKGRSAGGEGLRSSLSSSSYQPLATTRGEAPNLSPSPPSLRVNETSGRLETGGGGGRGTPGPGPLALTLSQISLASGRPPPT